MERRLIGKCVQYHSTPLTPFLKFHPISLFLMRLEIDLHIKDKNGFPINKTSCSLNEWWHAMSKFQLKKLLRLRVKKLITNKQLTRARKFCFLGRCASNRFYFLIIKWQEWNLHKNKIESVVKPWISQLSTKYSMLSPRVHSFLPHKNVRKIPFH